MDNTDEKFIGKAIEIAKRNIDEGGGPFGAIITLNEQIVATAGNRVVDNHDPTAHAEVLVIRKASSALGTHILTDCILYSSCEPCPMCLGAIYWSGIRKVVFSADRKDAANSGFNDEIIYREIQRSPDKRSVEFMRMRNDKGRSLFDYWDKYPGKVLY